MHRAGIVGTTCPHVQTSRSCPFDQGNGADVILSGVPLGIVFILFVGAMTGFVIWRRKHPYQPREYVTPTDNRDERDRPNAMFLWLWWFVFSPVVLFLAPTYSGRAKRLGFNETSRYWVPFWLTLATYAAAAILISMAMHGVHP